MSEIEKQGSADGVVLTFGREHALGDISTSAWLRTGIPHAPPLDGQWHNEEGEEYIHVVEIGDDT